MKKSIRELRQRRSVIPQVPRFTKADLSLIQLIKAGREGVFYKARIIRGTCRGHSLVTCKIGKEGITPKQMENEVSIMRKLAYHKNVMQLLDWNTAERKTCCCTS
ncbi:hypothetical protein cypCar_00050418, partial [Cyprinus carpio]